MHITSKLLLSISSTLSQLRDTYWRGMLVAKLITQIRNCFSLHLREEKVSQKVSDFYEPVASIKSIVRPELD
jgi:Trm5-related predicted tRNA methylase